MFACLTIDGTGDSHGTSAMIWMATFFYTVSSIFHDVYNMIMIFQGVSSRKSLAGVNIMFLLNPVVFGQIK
jgi:hypothetical protein